MKYIIGNGEGTKKWHALGELLGIWQRQQLSKQYGSDLKKSTIESLKISWKKKLSHLIYVAFLWSMNLSWPADPTKTTAFFPKQALWKVLALKMPLGDVDQDYTVYSTQPLVLVLTGRAIGRRSARDASLASTVRQS